MTSTFPAQEPVARVEYALHRTATGETDCGRWTLLVRRDLPERQALPLLLDAFRRMTGADFDTDMDIDMISEETE